MVGSALTARFREAGIAVKYLTRSTSGLRNSEDFQGYTWDPAAGTMDPEALKGVRAIVNLAGAPIAKRWTPKYQKAILESRTQSLRTLREGLRAVGSHQVEYLVSASAIGIYPDSETAYYSEADDQQVSGFLSETVAAWEAEARAFSQEGIPVGILRIGLVLAQDGGALPQMARPVRYYAGAPLGSGKQWQSWIHLTDLVSMFQRAVEDKWDGVYNAVAPNPVTHEKLISQVAEVLDRPLWLPKVPAWFLKLVLGQMASVVLISQRVSSEKAQMEGFSFQFCNLRPALEDLLGS